MANQLIWLVKKNYKIPSCPYPEGEMESWNVQDGMYGIILYLAIDTQETEIFSISAKLVMIDPWPWQDGHCNQSSVGGSMYCSPQNRQNTPWLDCFWFCNVFSSFFLSVFPSFLVTLFSFPLLVCKSYSLFHSSFQLLLWIENYFRFLTRLSSFIDGVTLDDRRILRGETMYDVDGCAKASKEPEVDTSMVSSEVLYWLSCGSFQTTSFFITIIITIQTTFFNFINSDVVSVLDNINRGFSWRSVIEEISLIVVEFFSQSFSLLITSRHLRHGS